MIYKLTIPSLDGVQELRVLQWHRSEGQQIEKDQLIVELETAKAVVEVRSARACILRKIAIGESDWAPVGPPLAWFSDTTDEALQTEDAHDFLPQWELI